MAQRAAKSVGAVLLVVMLGGCGGGSGGGDGSGGGGSSAATITDANADRIAGSALQVVDGTVELGDWLGDDALGLEATGLASALQPAAEVPCDDGGTLDIQWQDVDPVGELSAGDRVTLIADECAEDDSTTDGRVDIEVVSFGTDSAELVASFQNLRTADDDGSTLNGTMEFVVTSSADSVDLTVVSDSLVIDDDSGRSSIRELLLEHRDLIAANGYAWAYGAILDSPLFGGFITVVTDDDFEGTNGADPASGQLTIVGAGATSIIVIAIDALTARLEIDTDGDGTPDVIRERSWQALRDAADGDDTGDDAGTVE